MATCGPATARWLTPAMGKNTGPFLRVPDWAWIFFGGPTLEGRGGGLPDTLRSWLGWRGWTSTSWLAGFAGSLPQEKVPRDIVAINDEMKS